MSKWKTVKLGEVCEQINGVSYKPNDVSEALLDHYIPILRAHNIQDDGLNTDKLVYVREEIVNPKQIIKNDDIIICASSGSKNLVGKAAQASNSARISFGVFCKVIRPKNINGKYLGHFFQTPKYRQIISVLSAGANINNLRKEDIASLQIPLPPLEEQKRIADVLDKASNLIDLRKQQLEKMDLLIKSKFIDMFGDPVTNPKGWEIEKLGKHISVIGGYAFKSNGFSAHGIPVLRIGNINSGFFKSSNLVFWNEDKMLARYLLKPGDMVISLTGTVGKDDYGNVCILSNDYSQYYLNQRNAKLELRNTIEKQYLSNILKIPKIKNKLTDISRGVRQANISNADILNLCIPVPPIELQNQFAEFVEKVEKQKAFMQQSLGKMETNYKALMQEYFG